jgi:hypothetical protein
MIKFISACGSAVVVLQTPLRREVFVVCFSDHALIARKEFFLSCESLGVALLQFVIEQIGMFTPWMTA